MKRKKERIDTSAGREPLTDSPFASLGGQFEGLPAGPAPEPEAAPEARPWRVGKTRKGGYPLSLEKRGGGKSVTVLGNVEGDAKALLAELRKRCGAGGAAREGAVEIQGDHRAAIKDFLKRVR